MALTTPESFLEALEKSKLVDGEGLAQARKAAAQAGDAKSLAKRLIGSHLLTRWQAGRLLAGRTSFFLGKYKLIDLLGIGGIGQVFLARHTRMNRSVMLQIISKPVARDPEARAQFMAELRSVAALDHPHIVHTFDVDSDGNRYYLVMERVDGQDLQHLVESKGPLDPEHAADLVRQVADGLSYAHARGLVHHDVRPVNLVVGKEGVVKILGIGMARLAVGARAANGHEPPPSVDYLAPEQKADGARADHRADVYAMGATLFYLLAGRAPSAESGPAGIRDLRADVPEDLADLCAKMMAAEPESRFQSAEEVREALAAWLPVEVHVEGLEPSAEPDDAVEVLAVGADEEKKESSDTTDTPPNDGSAREIPPDRKRKLLLASVAGGAVLVVIVALAYLFGRSGDGSKPGDSTRLADQAGGPPGAGASASPSAGGEPGVGEGEQAWPALPDFGNLRDFDPQAFDDRGPAKPATQDAKPDPGAKQQPGAPKQEAQEAAKPAKPEPKEPAKPEVDEKPQPKEDSEDGEAEKPQPKEETEAAKPEKPEPDAMTQDDDPEKPEPEPAPSAADPLRDLPEAVDLPEYSLRMATTGMPEPFELGRIHTAPEVDWQLYLLGGDSVLKRNQKYRLDPIDREPAKASWMVRLETTITGKEPTQEDVARIGRSDNALVFQWAQEAPAAANYLRNCILQVRVEGSSRYLTLSTPVQVEPITIDLERGAANANVPVKWLPDASQVRVEITKVEGREGHATEPAEPTLREPFELHFPRTDRHGNTADRAAFRVLFTPRSTAMSVRVQLLEPPSTFFRGLGGTALIQRNQRETVLKKLGDQLSPKDKDKAPRGAERSQLIRQIDLVEKEMWYIDFYLEVHAKAQIHFRVFTEIDGRKVILATT